MPRTSLRFGSFVFAVLLAAASILHAQPTTNITVRESFPFLTYIFFDRYLQPLLLRFGRISRPSERYACRHLHLHLLQVRQSGYGRPQRESCEGLSLSSATKWHGHRDSGAYRHYWIGGSQPAVILPTSQSDGKCDST